MKCVLIAFCLISLTKAESPQFKHPHEINFNNEQLLAEIGKLDTIRQAANKDSVPYYHRLVKYLFRKQRFRADPRSDNYFIANIPLKLNKQQYELLVETDVYGLNLQEIDGLIEEVLKQSNSDDWQQLTSIVYDHYKQEIIDSVTSFSSPVLWIISSLIVIILLNKIFHFSRLKFVSFVFLVFFGICGISYYMTYLDCVKDLEVEQIMILSKEKSENNPCEKYQTESKDFFASLQTWITGSKKSECREYMKKTLNPSAKYCNPLEVFFKWLAKLQMSYFGSIFEEFTDFFSESTSSMDFVSRLLSKIVYLAFFGISTVFIVVMFLKYVVQSAPSYISHATSSTKNKDQEDSSMAILSAKMDAILKENVEIKREISVIRERSEEPQQIMPPSTKRSKLSSIKEAKSTASDDSTDSSEYS